MAVEAFAPAKINLTLHVTGRRPDGYHLLDSLVAFGDVGDRLRLTPEPEMVLDVTGPFAAGVPVDRRNLIWRAAEAAGWTGRIELEKHIPHGAGLGGGSADAAAVWRSLCGANAADMLGLDTVLALGADVPVCLTPMPQRMQGIGERLRPVRPVPVLNLVLVNPGVQVATPKVFRALAQRENPEMPHCDGWTCEAQFIDWLTRQRNDLELPACELAPEIISALEALGGSLLARMSGSGATCFGIYETPAQAHETASEIAARHSDWWVVHTQTEGAGQARRATT
ncbi:4-(cytidine 5'-diphospho)-2-C-methyl-D-erythritol kinase [Primorskyibacter marinus]|uniref:4-(cytidine 5'-diphospho)-2-C-methyl-D-erythritol kinase n=1 Tax=Primorskyibacter marinus TaxID=1977320 RepID=UPI000E304149|nr:4-(cytidine 5'-diphospho)-2-C-methyl-D-erythritol kinase [Primorskyibacter marinus]